MLLIINTSIQYNGGFLPDIMLLILCHNLTSQRNPCTDAERTHTCVAPRHVDASRDFCFVFLSERAARGGGGGGGVRCQTFFFPPVQQTTSGIGHRVKVFFLAWQPIR